MLNQTSLKISACTWFLGTIVLGGCATTAPQVSEPGVSLPQRSGNPIELPQNSAAQDSRSRAIENDAGESAQVFLSKKQHTAPDRSPTQAWRELARLTDRYDQDVNLCEGLRTDSEPVKVPLVAKPPHMNYYWDPTFRSKVIRISDTGDGDVIKPMYSTIQAWNADESLMILYHSGGAGQGHHLYNGKTYEHIRTLRISPSDVEQVFWSHTEPDYFYHVSRDRARNNELLKTNARTGKITRLADLSPMCSGGAVPTAGTDVQMQSWDDDLFGFRCGEAGIAGMFMHTYRVSTGEIRSQRIGQGTSWDTWMAPNPAPSGTRLKMNDKVINSDLTSTGITLDVARHYEHSSLGQTKAGDDALYAVAFDPSPAGCGDADNGVGHLVEHNLATGECRPLITESMGYPYTTSGTHISALAHLRPSWVALSSIGYPQDFVGLANGDTVPTFFSEIYLVNTDPDNAAVCRVAQHRSYGKGAKNASYVAYFGEPHVTISPSGTRLLFGSDWYDSGSVDAYVVELPAYANDQR